MLRLLLILGLIWTGFVPAAICRASLQRSATPAACAENCCLLQCCCHLEKAPPASEPTPPAVPARGSDTIPLLLFWPADAPATCDWTPFTASAVREALRHLPQTPEGVAALPHVCRWQT